MLENSVFSKAESSQISDKYTAVKLVGGNDLDDEGKAFMKRYGVQGYPTLLAMTPEGAVIGRNFQRSIEGILSTMDGSATANEEFLKQEAELAAKTDDESVHTLAGLYMERAQLEEARSRFEKLAAEAPELEDQQALLEIYASMDDQDARKALLTKLVETRKDDAQHIEWRMELAMSGLPSSVTSREEWIEVMGKRKTALEGLLPSVEKTEDQAVVRGMLAQILANTGDGEAAESHWDWILENAPKSEAAASALWLKGNGLIRQGQVQGDVEKIKQAKTLWEQLAKDHPETMVGQRAAQVMPQLDGLIQRMEQQKAEAEKAKADAEKKADEEKKDDEDKDAEKKDSVPATPIR